LSGAVCTPRSFAQHHFAVGAYADYFRLSETDTHSVGVGARLGVALRSQVMLEGEMSYDFGQTFDEGFDNGTTIIVQRTNVRLLHGPVRTESVARAFQFSSLSNRQGWVPEC
jgi:hypothetical protein